MEFVLAAIVLAGIVALFVLNPLRKPEVRARADEDRREELEAAKEQKYREIRDAELDYRMGKLAEADWREADAELRNDAMRILRDLDALAAGHGDAADGADADAADGVNADAADGDGRG
jgi:hypothetical protein